MSGKGGRSGGECSIEFFGVRSLSDRAIRATGNVLSVTRNFAQEFAKCEVAPARDGLNAGRQSEARSPLRDPFSCFACAQISADVLSGLLLSDGIEDSSVNLLSFFGEAEIFEHHRCRRDRSNRVRDVLSCKRRS